MENSNVALSLLKDLDSGFIILPIPNILNDLKCANEVGATLITSHRHKMSKCI